MDPLHEQRLRALIQPNGVPQDVSPPAQPIEHWLHGVHSIVVDTWRGPNGGMWGGSGGAGGRGRSEGEATP